MRKNHGKGAQGILGLAGLAVCLASLWVPAWADGLWQPDGVTVCATFGDQDRPQIISDGSGGAIFAWADVRNGWPNVYAQRLDAHGNTLWANQGVAIFENLTSVGSVNGPELASDGSGGALVVWDDWRNTTDSNIYIQRVDANGNTRWAYNGITICSAARDQTKEKIVSDGAGGGIVTWVDNRSTTRNEIYAQRVNAAGTVQWAANGKLMGTSSFDQTNPAITADGSGGAVVAWEQYIVAFGHYNIFAQRVNAGGTLLWAAVGKPVSQVNGQQQFIQLKSDGAGGAIAVWQDYRGAYADGYAQRIDASGNTRWASGDVALSNAPDIKGAQVLTSDGAGGAIFAWADASTNDIACQRLDNTGNPLWGAAGVIVRRVLGNISGSPQIISDGAGGAIVAWDDARNSSYDIYCQRLDGNGNVLWTPNGSAITLSIEAQTSPQLANDSLNGAIIVWKDNRNWASLNLDVFAQRIVRPNPNVTQATPSRAPWGKVARSVVLNGNLQDDKGRTTLVALTRPGYSSITATALTLTGNTSATADFDLTGAAVGNWTFRSYDNLGQTSSASASFEVFPPTAQNLNWVSVPGGTLYTGSQDGWIGQINCTVDGYDSLQSVQVRNLGTAQADTDIYRLWLWYKANGGSGGLTFDTQAQRWGQFTRTGTKTWSFTLGPAKEILTGCALYLTADISGGAQVGRTLQMAMAPGGASFLYGNTLPAAGLFNLNEQTIALAASARLSLSSPATVNFLKGQTNAALGQIQVQNITGANLLLKALQVSLVDAAGQSQGLNRALAKATLSYQGTPVASLSAPFSGGQWVLANPLTISAQGSITLDLTGDIAANPGITHFQMALLNGQCVNQGELLAEGSGGLLFPLVTAPLHLRAQDLGAVFSAYPNPFNPGQGNTKITYYLKGQGRARLQVRQVGGALVKTLADAEAPAGLHETVWDGSNERGQKIISGVYLLVIDVKYADGSSQRLTRKLALVR